jgi:molybdenum cofactor cytidylyltransferase
MNDLSAIVLAAGLSQRMGQPKVLLPWGDTTVLGKVVGALAQAGLNEILVVTGAAREAVEVEVYRLAAGAPVRAIYNPGYERGEMLSSIQAGVSSLAQTGWAAGARIEIRPVATLIALGDQPQARPESVRQILEAFGRSRSALILPSYERRRGHPWLVRSERGRTPAMQPPETARLPIATVK